MIKLYHGSNVQISQIDLIGPYRLRLQYMKGITFQYAFCTPEAIDKLVRYEYQ